MLVKLCEQTAKTLFRQKTHGSPNAGQCAGKRGVRMLNEQRAQRKHRTQRGQCRWPVGSTRDPGPVHHGGHWRERTNPIDGRIHIENIKSKIPRATSMHRVDMEADAVGNTKDKQDAGIPEADHRNATDTTGPGHLRGEPGVHCYPKCRCVLPVVHQCQGASGT